MKIVCVGSGNVAWHLSNRLSHAGHKIVQVFSRSIENANLLAETFDCKAINDFKNLNAEADIYLSCLRDDITEKLSKNFPFFLGPDQIICHTSGILPSNIFQHISENYGSLYPFQTLTKNVQLDHDKLPLAIQANTVEVTAQIELFAKQISTQVFRISDQQKQYLHVAGVLANNFTNHLTYYAQEVLTSQNIDPHVLNPLLLNTVEKLQKISAYAAQTGPAIRNDVHTISKHLELIDNPKLKQIYLLITDSIINTYHENS